MTENSSAERRLKIRKKRAERDRTRNQDLCPGINDLGDALEAMPMDVVRHFTLLQEIDAKCIGMMPALRELIGKFFEFPPDSNQKSVREEREACLENIRKLVRELMPCQEEKMHVAGVAAETVQRYVKRVDFDYNFVEQREIPEYVRYGPINHPAIITDTKQTEQPKGAQTSRSESRREAIAAKKAAAAQAQEKRPSGRSALSGSNTTGVAGGREPKKPGPKPKKPNTPQPATAQLASVKKRARGDEEDDDEVSRPGTPTYSTGPAIGGNSTVSGSNSGGGGAPTAKRSRNRTGNAANSAHNVPVRAPPPKDEDKDVYCYCQQVSFGDMVGCDGPDCKLEWFHLPCIGLSSPPKGQWYCDECSVKNRKKRV